MHIRMQSNLLLGGLSPVSENAAFCFTYIRAEFLNVLRIKIVHFFLLWPMDDDDWTKEFGIASSSGGNNSNGIGSSIDKNENIRPVSNDTSVCKNILLS